MTSTQMCTCADLGHRTVIQFQAHCTDLTRITGRHLASIALITVSTHTTSLLTDQFTATVFRPTSDGLQWSPPPQSFCLPHSLILVTCGTTPVYPCLIKHTCTQLLPARSASTLVTTHASAVVFRHASSFQPNTRYQIHIDIKRHYYNIFR